MTARVPRPPLNEFIETTAGELGVDTASVRAATGGLFEMLQSRIVASDFEQLLREVPGAKAMLEHAPKRRGWPGLMRMASQTLTGKAGLTMEVAGVLSAAGLPQAAMKPFGLALGRYLQGRVSGDLVERIAAQFPSLKLPSGWQSPAQPSPPNH